MLMSEETRLSLTPPLDAGEVTFLAGFSRERLPTHDGRQGALQPEGRPARIWPGQPTVPSPWAPCDQGCCLVLVSARPGIEAAGQWLRFLLAEFLAGPRRVEGWVRVVGIPGRRPALLIVEAGEVFEGQLGDTSEWSG